MSQYSLNETTTAQALVGPVSVRYKSKSSDIQSYQEKRWYAEDWTNGEVYSTAQPYYIKNAQVAVGPQGVDGKSAYELYCEAYPEYTGTLEEWLASLKGETGAAGRGIVKTELSGTNWIIYYTDGTTETHDLSVVLGGVGGDNTSSDYTDGLSFSLLPDGTYGVSAGTTIYLSEIVIPSTYNGKPVTKILDNGFKDCLALSKISVPDSITHIGDYAFSGCSNLAEFDIPKENAAINYYGNYAFYKCEKLTEIYIPEGTQSIGDYTFNRCKAVTSLTLPSTLTHIGDAAITVAYNKLENVSINCEGKWRKAEQSYSPNGTYYYKKADGSFAASSNSGYSYSYLFVEDMQLFFEEMEQNGKVYVQFSTSSDWPTTNKYIACLENGTLYGNWDRVE